MCRGQTWGFLWATATSTELEYREHWHRPTLADSDLPRLGGQRSPCKTHPPHLISASKSDCEAMAHSHEEINSIIHQGQEGYFSNEEDDPLSTANQTPFYAHNGVPIEWPNWDESWWWIRCDNGMDTRGYTYWCFARHPLDPPVDAVPFRFIDSRARLQFVEEAIAERRSYLIDDGEEVLPEDTRRLIDEHGMPAWMRYRSLCEWYPPVVTQQNPPEWSSRPWGTLMTSIMGTVYPWDSESRRGWAPESLDGGDGPASGM